MTRSLCSLLRGLLAWFRRLLSSAHFGSGRAIQFILQLLRRIRYPWPPTSSGNDKSLQNEGTPEVVKRTIITIAPSQVPNSLLPPPVTQSFHNNRYSVSTPNLSSPSPSPPPSTSSSRNNDSASSDRPDLVSSSSLGVQSSGSQYELQVVTTDSSASSRSHMDMPTPQTPAPGVHSLQTEGGDTELVLNTPYPFPYTGAPVDAPPVIRHVNFAPDPDREGRIKRLLVPIPASDVMRYHRAVKIRSKNKTHIIKPNTYEMRDDDRSHMLYRRAGWQSRVHPEGALYFWHPEMRTFTDANLIKKGTLEAVTNAIHDLRAKIVADEIEMPPSWELVLEVMQLRKAAQVGYYFVNHGNRCLFWLHDYNVASMLGNVKGVKFWSHIKYAMEAQFWMHVEFYPNNRKVPRNIFEELKEIVMHASAETITSDTSLAPFDNEELAKICDLIDRIEVSVDKPYEHSMCIIARFMRMFARTRFFNFCGQIGARLDADQTVYYKDKRRRSILLRIMSPFLFGAPEVHMRALKTIWVDQLVNHIPWKKFVDKLNDEWQSYTLYSTVILNSNVAFLALYNVSPQPQSDSTGPYPQTSAQIASYVSTVASMGSVIVGLLLLRQNRTKGRESAEEAVYFMTKVTNTMFGTETLAIIYSLPYGLLLWGMVFFVIAFCFLALQETSLTTRGTVGASGVLVLVFVLWSVTASTEMPYWLTAQYGWELVSKWIKTVAKLLGIDAKARARRGRSTSRRRSRSRGRRTAQSSGNAGSNGSASTSGSENGDSTTEVDTESESGASDGDDE